MATQLIYKLDQERKKIARVSSILDYCEDLQNNEYIKRWRERNPNSEEIKNKYAKIGTKIHKQFHLEAKNPVEAAVHLTTFSKEESKRFQKFLPFCSTFQPILMEQKFIYEDPLFTYRGTFDALGYLDSTQYVNDIDGNIVLVDWKNFKKQKNFKYMIRYFLQLGAYVLGVNNTSEYKASGCVLVTGTERSIHHWYLKPELVEFYISKWFECLEFFYTKKKYDWGQLELDCGCIQDSFYYERDNKFPEELIFLNSKEDEW